MTIDPVSTANPGWTDVPRGLQPVLQRPRRHSAAEPDSDGDARADREGLGDRWKQFADARKTYDPNNRLLNDYFRDLLELSGSVNWRSDMLSTPWEQRKNTVRLRDHRIGVRRRHRGSAAGGRQPELRSPRSAFWSAARNASPASFRRRWPAWSAEARSSANPLGLFELLNYPDISVIKGSGLGGTSLINANVAIEPDHEVFEQFNWPAAITLRRLAALLPAGAGRAGALAASARHATRQGAGAEPAGAGDSAPRWRRSTSR